jgi:hypothetical protein
MPQTFIDKAKAAETAAADKARAARETYRAAVAKVAGGAAPTAAEDRAVLDAMAAAGVTADQAAADLAMVRRHADAKRRAADLPTLRANEQFARRALVEHDAETDRQVRDLRAQRAADKALRSAEHQDARGRLKAAEAAAAEAEAVELDHHEWFGGPTRADHEAGKVRGARRRYVVHDLAVKPAEWGNRGTDFWTVEEVATNPNWRLNAGDLSSYTIVPAPGQDPVVASELISAVQTGRAGHFPLVYLVRKADRFPLLAVDARLTLVKTIEAVEDNPAPPNPSHYLILPHPGQTPAERNALRDRWREHYDRHQRRLAQERQDVARPVAIGAAD